MAIFQCHTPMTVHNHDHGISVHERADLAKKLVVSRQVEKDLSEQVRLHSIVNCN